MSVQRACAQSSHGAGVKGGSCAQPHRFPLTKAHQLLLLCIAYATDRRDQYRALAKAPLSEGFSQPLSGKLISWILSILEGAYLSTLELACNLGTDLPSLPIMLLPATPFMDSQNALSTTKIFYTLLFLIRDLVLQQKCAEIGLCLTTYFTTQN